MKMHDMGFAQPPSKPGKTQNHQSSDQVLSKYPDFWATILFGLNLLVILTFSGIGFKYMINPPAQFGSVIDTNINSSPGTISVPPKFPPSAQSSFPGSSFPPSSFPGSTFPSHSFPGSTSSPSSFPGSFPPNSSSPGRWPLKANDFSAQPLKMAVDTSTITVEGVDNLHDRNLLIFVSIGGIVFVAVLSAIYLKLMQEYPVQMIKFTFVISAALPIVLALIMIVKHHYIFAALLIVFALLIALFYYLARSRIPLAAIILETVCNITKKYPSCFFTAIIAVLVANVYCILWSIGVKGARNLLEAKGKESLLPVVLLFMMFSLFWTLQIIKNIMHVTISGAVGSYYFLDGTPSMPSNPVLESSKRAVTTSLGPICFGSLIVAIVQTIRALLKSAAKNGNAVVVALMDCFISTLEKLIQFINEYAFVQVALYGKSFCQAGKATWQLIKSNGIDLIINDNLISNVLTIGILLVGFVGASTVFLTLTILSKYPIYSQISVVTAIVFLMGVGIMNIVAQVIHSGVITTFVCLAEDPRSLARTKPDLYQRFRDAYPQIAWKV